MKTSTVGFKVTPAQKRAIAQTAQRLDMDVSTYLRGLCLERHPTLEARAIIPEMLVFSEAEISEVLSIIEQLRSANPKLHPVPIRELMISALRLALDNQHRIVSNKLKNYVEYVE